MRQIYMALLAGLALAPAWAVEPVKFSQALQAKFHHDRCLQCHQFNSRKSNGRAYHSHRSRYLCEQCHRPQLTGLAGGEWMAPAGEKMDYTGLNAADTCRLVKRNAPSGVLSEQLAHHLLHDGRVRWAIDSGRTPAGPRPTLPGGYAEWEQDVKAWVAGGMSCE
jgi:hypothetical protein